MPIRRGHWGLVRNNEQFLPYLDRPVVYFGHCRWRELGRFAWLVEAPAAPACAARASGAHYEYGPDGRHALDYAGAAGEN